MAGLYTNGLPAVLTATGTNSYPQLQGNELIAVDTQKASGSTPQSVAASAFQIAAIAAGVVGNTATSTSAAGTLNTLSGKIITEALTTAVASTYAMVLTNSIITATSTVQAEVFSLTNTTPGFQVTAIVPAAGSCTITCTNNGAAAINGTVVITFYIAKV